MNTYWIPDITAENLEWYHTNADWSFISKDKEMAHIVQEWADGHDMFMPAMSIDDVGQKGFEKVLIELRLQRAETTAWTVLSRRNARNCRRRSN